MTSPPENYFEKQNTTHITSLNLDIDVYQHTVTGTYHYHLNSDNNENVFLVGLRTVPQDSQGVAHILEHTALCGSQHYPVRDPFFMMIRRSLNTFMNAFTSSDWTAYPFASQNKKDYFNLLDVYLDAVFFSNLDELDFAQEGHRLEFEETENPNSDLVYKGVVYNEMKGAMSSPISVLWQTLTKHIFPTTTYHYNSGGEPEDIPDLTYDALKSFYKTYYHPSNAIFFTYGDIPAEEHQNKIHQQVLQHFTKLDKTISVDNEKRYPKPIKVTEKYALEDETNPENKNHVVVGWLLGESADLDYRMKATLLSSVLLDNGSSPLRYVLESTDLGSSPSPLCGLEDSNREMIFMCGLEGGSADSSQAIENMILETLEKVCANDVEQSRIDAALHQLELSQKEITGGSYPYGLQLILDMLPVAVHRGDPVSAIDIDDVLQRLREQTKEADFFPKLIKSMLIDNQHRVCLTLEPDATLSEEKIQREKEKLAKIKSTLSDSQKQSIVALSLALKERQEREDDEELLPKVGVEDIPNELYIADGQETKINNVPVKTYAQGTNGIVYQQLVFELPKLNESLLDVLPLFTNCLGELGSADRDYLQTQALIDQVTGGISAFSSMRTTIDDSNDNKGYLVVSGKALRRNHHALTDLLVETYNSIRFDELPRIRELVAQRRAQKENSITGNGHGLALTAASAGMNGLANLRHKNRGLVGIQHLKALDDTLDDNDSLQTLANQLEELHKLFLAAPMKMMLIGEDDAINEMLDSQQNKIRNEYESNVFVPFGLTPVSYKSNEFWVANTQINFCAKAFPAVSVGHPDAPAFMVLGGFLRNGFLHRVIREQGGAYGAGASYDSDSASFRFYSYRDPRLLETLEDFDRCIAWLLETKHEKLKLEEAIMGVISSIDKPSSPAGEAKSAFHNELFGRTATQRKEMRNKILNVTLDDLRRVGENYFSPKDASQAIVSQQSALDLLGDEEFQVHYL